MRFGLLGPLEVHVDSRPVPVPGAIPRAVLALLLTSANQVVGTEILVDRIWGDAAPRAALASLHNHVMRLRKQLGPRAGARVRTLSPGYVIDVAAAELDVSVFELACRRGHQALADEDWASARREFSQAIALWRGEPGAGLPVGVVPMADVQRLVEMRWSAYDGRITADLRLGRYSEALPDLRILTVENPFAEDFHAKLMLTLHQVGRQGEALAAYQNLRKGLIDELGVEPSARLSALNERILVADPELQSVGVDRDPPIPAQAGVPRPLGVAPHSVPAQLPRDVRDFTGRQTSVAELCELLLEGAADGQARPVVVSAVTGIGGVGKTTLVLHVGHRVLDEYPDGQLYVDLRGTSDVPRDPTGVLADFLSDLGEPAGSIPQDAAACQARFRSVSAGRRLLIVLDDARDAAQVRPLLPGSGACAVLVTSRGRLSGLAGAVGMNLGFLTSSEARELLTSVVGPARVRAEPEAVERVLGFCGGLPLAVRIAASRLASRPTWTVAAFADRLADERHRLDELRVEDVAVRATFELSYASLQDVDTATATLAATEGPAVVSPARAFRLLGLLPGPTFAASAAAVLFDLPLHRTEDLLDSLVVANLLDEPSPGRFRFHDLLRTFATELAWSEEPASSRAAAVSRLLGWYVHTAAAAVRCARPYRTSDIEIPEITEAPNHPIPVFDSYDGAMSWYDQERRGLVAAVGLAERMERHDVAWQLPYMMFGFFYLRNHTADWVATHEAAIAASRKLGHVQAEALIWNRLGNAYYVLNKYTDAMVCYERSLAGMQTFGDRYGEAKALTNLGVLSAELGRYDEALEYNAKSMELYQELGDLYGHVDNLNNRADVLRQVGRLQEAAETTAKALGFVREHGLRGNEVYLLITSGEIHEALGLDHEALDDFQAAAESARGIGSLRLEAISLDLAGRRLAARGRTSEAVDAWRKALAIMKESGDPMASEVADRLYATLDEAPSMP
ncbi:AfsR/SARP family transcriptional regulator [Catenulispora rubra]|uniref:AfsR/SARP family transcriptional regulator n=1 Tax=Catenulispora rubra TaxID=280293 RepID=UPI001E49699C|nr:BTAD domain-containing putative transcriptional regulator [Catenulispora rubra]